MSLDLLIALVAGNNRRRLRGRQSREVGIWRLQLEADCRGIDGDDLLDRFKYLTEVGFRLGVKKALEGKDHVVGRELLAVVELNPRSQLECPLRRVVIGRPGSGQLRLVLQLRILVDSLSYTFSVTM